MREQILSRLEHAHNLYLDFAEHVPDQYFHSKLANLPSNTIGQQLWCVVGARNSYHKAALAGSWQGFACPLEWKDTGNKDAVKQALSDTGSTLIDYIRQLPSLTAGQTQILMDALEHEVQHQGQLIRYLYGLKLGVPASWKSRYHLD